jgi:hypothetical protein
MGAYRDFVPDIITRSLEILEEYKGVKRLHSYQLSPWTFNLPNEKCFEQIQNTY